MATPSGSSPISPPFRSARTWSARPAGARSEKNTCELARPPGWRRTPIDLIQAAVGVLTMADLAECAEALLCEPGQRAGGEPGATNRRPRSRTCFTCFIRSRSGIGNSSNGNLHRLTGPDAAQGGPGNRLARAWPAYPRLCFGRPKAWMPTDQVRGLKAHGPSPAKTRQATRFLSFFAAAKFSPDTLRSHQ